MAMENRKIRGTHIYMRLKHFNVLKKLITSMFYLPNLLSAIIKRFIEVKHHEVKIARSLCEIHLGMHQSHI